MDMIMKTALMALSAAAMLSCGPKGDPQLGKASIDKVIGAMTLEEKAHLVIGTGMAGTSGDAPVIGETRNLVPGAAGTTYPIPRLGIPAIVLADGPAGLRINPVREGDEATYYCTHFPIGTLLASTWNQELVEQVGNAIGEEVLEYGADVLLAPALNIHRNPLCGRNFEYMGEDPYLASTMAVSYIKGVQSQGVMATAKHFALNNQEYDRHHVSSDADERTMHEIYFPAFKAAVEEAHVGSVMTSYNLVNNVHAAENPYLIREVLKGKWGFDGFVMSDWTSTYTALGCVKGGLDLEMPRAFLMNMDEIRPLMESGAISEREIDEKVQNILQSLIAFGFLDREQKDASIPEDNPYSREVAYRMACESPVLLKNNGILPLKAGKKNSIAVLGPNADRIPCVRRI